MSTDETLDADPGGRAGPVLAVVDLLERDGHVRASHAVTRWPLRIGRAIDNDLVLADPHVAPHHLRIDAADGGLVLQAGETRNGVQCGARQLAGGEQWRAGDTPLPPLTIGRTRLRLRRAGDALEPELPLAVTGGTGPRLALAACAVALVAALAFDTWLGSDPDDFARALGMAFFAAIAGAAVWCGAWALLSRIFTRHAQFGWHLRVFVISSLAWLLAQSVPGVLAFALDWPWIADFAFIGTYAVAGAALYAHLLAVEPARPRLMRGVGAAAALGGIALTLWLNHQRSDDWGQDLYMTHLLPPSMRLAGAKPVGDFVDRLAPLQAELDRLARQPDNGSDAGDEE